MLLNLFGEGIFLTGSSSDNGFPIFDLLFETLEDLLTICWRAHPFCSIVWRWEKEKLWSSPMSCDDRFHERVGPGVTQMNAAVERAQLPGASFDGPAEELHHLLLLLSLKLLHF